MPTGTGYKGVEVGLSLGSFLNVTNSLHPKGAQTSHFETMQRQHEQTVSFLFFFFTSRVNYLNYFTARERDR